MYDVLLMKVFKTERNLMQLEEPMRVQLSLFKYETRTHLSMVAGYIGPNNLPSLQSFLAYSTILPFSIHGMMIQGEC